LHYALTARYPIICTFTDDKVDEEGVWSDGTQHFWCGDRNRGDVWFIKRPMANPEHPTMKPVELVERALRNSSKTRDTILDPFGGSGTTLIACERANRQARVIELDPKYCDVIVRRWQDYTGDVARHADSGRAFGKWLRLFFP
jgi:DNA modification methylase